MPIYSCPRCGYNSHIKTYLYKHFMRKNKCKAKLLDISVEESFKQVLGYEMEKNDDSQQILKNESDMRSVAPTCADSVNTFAPTCADSVNTFDPTCAEVSLPVSLGVNALAEVSPPVSHSVSPEVSALAEVSPLVSHLVSPEVSALAEVSPKVSIPMLSSSMSKNEDNKYKCPFCSKLYNHKQSLWRHKKKCCSSGKQINNNYLNDNHFIEKLKDKDSEIADKDSEIDDLKKQVEMLKSKPNTNIMGDQVNITQYVILNAFGKEDMKYITPEKIKKLISRGPMNSVPKLLQDIHFNTEHNENHNIFIPNKKQPYAKIYDGDKWIYKKKKEAIEDMTHKALDLIINTDGTNEYNKIAQIRDDYDDGDKKTVERIHEDTEIMILNNQNSIKHR